MNSMAPEMNHYDDENNNNSSSLESSNEMATESWEEEEEEEEEELSSSDLSSPVERHIPLLPRPNDVCFKSCKHQGTVAWRDVVRKFSDRSDLYPEWNDHICTLVREELARVSIKRYLVSLDGKGRPSKRIKDGMWYQAMDREILKRTKERFIEDRKERYKERAKNAMGQTRPVGRPKKQQSEELPNGSMMMEAYGFSMDRSLAELVKLHGSLSQELRGQPLDIQTIIMLMKMKSALEHLHGFILSQLQRYPQAVHQFHPPNHHYHVAANAPEQQPSWRHAPNMNLFPPVNPFDGELVRQVATVPVNTASSMPTAEPTTSSSLSTLKPPPQPPTAQLVDETLLARPHNSRNDSDDLQRRQYDVMNGVGLAQTVDATPDVSHSAPLARQWTVAQTSKVTPDVPRSASLPSRGFTSENPHLSKRNKDVGNHENGQMVDENVGNKSIASSRKSAPVVPTSASVGQAKNHTARHDPAPNKKVTVMLDYENDEVLGNMAVIAGKPLTGTVVLDVDDTVDYQGGGRLSVRVVGKEEIFLDMTPIIKSSMDIFDQRVLVRDLSKDGLVRGVNKIPFSISLPEILPSSAGIDFQEHAIMKVSYELQVMHEVKGRGDPILKKPILVHSRPLSGNSIPILWGPKTHELRSMGFLKKGSLSLGVRLDDSQIGRGQILEMSIACRNHSSVDIKRVHVKLVEQIQWFDVEFRDLHPYHIERIVLCEIKDLNLPTLTKRGSDKSQIIHNSGDDKEAPDHQEIIKELESGVNRFTLTIPEQCHDSYQGKMAAITHYIKIKLMTRFSTDNLSATLPLTIGFPSLPSSASKEQPPEQRPPARPLSEKSMSTVSIDSALVAGAKESVSALTQATRLKPAQRTVSTAPSSAIASNEDISAPVHFSQASMVPSVAAAPGSTVAASVASRGVARNPISTDILLRRLISDLKSGDDSYKVISQKIVDGAWVEFFASLNAEEFGRIIAHVRMDSDRPRVAELVAPHVQVFTCQHAATAIQKTSFRVSMAKSLVPLCTNKASHMSLITKQLDEWDMNLLSIGLNQKLQME